MTRYRVERVEHQHWNMSSEIRHTYLWKAEWSGGPIGRWIRIFPTWREAYDFAYREARKEKAW